MQQEKGTRGFQGPGRQGRELRTCLELYCAVCKYSIAVPMMKITVERLDPGLGLDDHADDTTCHLMTNGAFNRRNGVAQLRLYLSEWA